ncbi:hypothetical protein B9Z55_019116 [Caenorhabditis nigoni]|nr:hypothetical protein B9Z55_019116 [Caenorhabditis nigoni]
MIGGNYVRLYLLVDTFFSEHDGVPDDLLKVYTASGCMKVVESVLTVRTPTATIDFTPNFIGRLLDTVDRRLHYYEIMPRPKFPNMGFLRSEYKSGSQNPRTSRSSGFP